MLELPEVVVIARQMQAELPGRRIVSVVCAASPHKFAFFNHPPEIYSRLLLGTTVTEVRERGGYIVMAVEPPAALLFGDVGGRIRFHRDPATIPAKHQLLLTFADGSALTVSIVLWGGIKVAPPADVDKEIHSLKRLSPLSAGFSYVAFERLLDDPDQRSTKSAKLFMISKPGLCGVGNGCLQDILFQAKIHPRRRMITLSPQDVRDLYEATRTTIELMVAQGGRDSESDLYGLPGGYQTILDRDAAGKPCPSCGTPIEKAAYLGGAVYFCPVCQPLPAG
jgi:formamidopyrimidine-DNA glycosylase